MTNNLANNRQIGGNHYQTQIQHWDYVVANDFDYFQGQITKYITRWKRKNGIADLYKAQHFLDKYIELARVAGWENNPVTPAKTAEASLYKSDPVASNEHPDEHAEATRAYVNQD